MAQKPAHMKIMPILEPYLDRKDFEFWSKGGKKPTLPITTDNKVNVRELVRELMLEPGAAGVIIESHQQHFFNQEELTNPVNALAVTQDVGIIGSRNLSNGDDEVVRGQISRIKKSSKAENESMVELAAENARLRKEVAAFKADRQHVHETGMFFPNGKVKT